MMMVIVKMYTRNSLTTIYNTQNIETGFLYNVTCYGQFER